MHQNFILAVYEGVKDDEMCVIEVCEFWAPKVLQSQNNLIAGDQILPPMIVRWE